MGGDPGGCFVRIEVLPPGVTISLMAAAVRLRVGIGRGAALRFIFRSLER